MKTSKLGFQNTYTQKKKRWTSFRKIKGVPAGLSRYINLFPPHQFIRSVCVQKKKKKKRSKINKSFFFLGLIPEKMGTIKDCENLCLHLVVNQTKTFTTIITSFFFLQERCVHEKKEIAEIDIRR